ncbi:TPMT family class I SAM-dependent methyltransferase [Akkermansiaceae bacterium]|nr:TPMT family class I SAM-dependent methyltransferase [Akkermansiaceae bacterium]
MDWDKRYENHDTPWDKGAPAPVLIELLKTGEFQCVKTYPEVLIPGCGYGHDVREIASAGYQATGIDISEKALHTARFLTTGNQELSTFSGADLFDPELPKRKRYDAIWEHTCYCAIDPDLRADYVKAVHDLLKPEGLLIGVFFTTEQTKPGPPHMTNPKDLHRLFSKHFELLWEKAPELYYPARAGKEWLMCWRRR